MNQPLLNTIAMATTLLANIVPASATALVVDVNSAPGIQTSISVPPGTTVTADLYLISDGITTMDTYGVAMEYNDTPGVLAPIPTIPTATAAPNPPQLPPPGASIFSAGTEPLVDLSSSTTLHPGTLLASFFFPPQNSGRSGHFTASDGGSGMFNPNWSPNNFFGSSFIPEAGAMIFLQRLRFTAAAPGTTEIFPAGIMDPIGGAIFPPDAVLDPWGLPFYDSWFGIATPATSVPSSGFPDPITPGTVTVVPEPSTLFAALMTTVLFWRRRRPC